MFSVGINVFERFDGLGLVNAVQLCNYTLPLISPGLIHVPKNEEYLEGLINKWRGLYPRVPTLNNRNRKSALKQALAELIRKVKTSAGRQGVPLNYSSKIEGYGERL